MWCQTPVVKLGCFAEVEQVSDTSANFGLAAWLERVSDTAVKLARVTEPVLVSVETPE